MSAFKPDGDEIFLRVPDSSGTRRLYRTRHVGTEDEELALELGEELAIGIDQALFLLYEQKRKFMQQPARVVRTAFGGRQVVVAVTADAIFAESRLEYRCPTGVEGIVAQVGSEKDCKVLDLSKSGFAALAQMTFALGSKLDVAIGLDSDPFAGIAVVQSVQILPTGETRYGFRVVGGPLQSSLTSMLMTVQRAQLRRRSGA